MARWFLLRLLHCTASPAASIPSPQAPTRSHSARLKASEAWHLGPVLQSPSPPAPRVPHSLTVPAAKQPPPPPSVPSATHPSQYLLAPPPRPSATPPPSEYPCHPSLAACVLPYLQPAASLPAPPAVRQAHACPGRHRGPLSLAGLDAEEPHQPLDLCADTHAKSLGRHLSSGLSLFNPPGLCANTNAKGFGRHLGLG
jgi:hypothetical protein